jgi:hypothetical protein
MARMRRKEWAASPQPQAVRHEADSERDAASTGQAESCPGTW